MITLLIIKITISSIVTGLNNSYFPLIHLPSCYRTVCYWTVCYRTVQFKLVINKSDSRCAVVRFCYHSYDYRPNWTTRSLIPINHKNYNFREKKNSQVMKEREIYKIHYKITYRPKGEKEKELNLYQLNWRFIVGKMVTYFKSNFSTFKECFDYFSNLEPRVISRSRNDSRLEIATLVMLAFQTRFTPTSLFQRFEYFN